MSLMQNAMQDTLQSTSSSDTSSDTSLDTSSNASLNEPYQGLPELHYEGPSNHILCYNCEECSDCKECNYCKHCQRSKHCERCEDCEDCKHCELCNGCKCCEDCYQCNKCEDCEHCHGCKNCETCYRCKECKECSLCEDCERCDECSMCQECKDCVDCKECYYCYNSQHISNCVFMKDNQRYDPGFEVFEQLFEKIGFDEMEDIYYNEQYILKNCYSIQVYDVRQQQIEDLQKELQEARDLNKQYNIQLIEKDTIIDQLNADNYLLRQQKAQSDDLVQQFCGICTDKTSQ